jgi:hypothetical protein
MSVGDRSAVGRYPDARGVHARSGEVTAAACSSAHALPLISFQDAVQGLRQRSRTKLNEGGLAPGRSDLHRLDRTGLPRSIGVLHHMLRHAFFGEQGRTLIGCF